MQSQKAHRTTLLSAQQRAVATRQKASFGNSSSGYEFGGWKSLFEDCIESSKSSLPNSSINSPKPESHSKKTASNSPKNKATLCPSSQPHNEDAIVFGVVEGTIESPHVSYLKRSHPVAEVVHSSTIEPTEMLRIAASCQEKQCLHFDGSDCRLAAKIVEQLSSVTETLPVCQIRRSCRWWQQEGKSACMRCPQVVTKNYYSSPLLEKVADPNTTIG